MYILERKLYSDKNAYFKTLLDLCLKTDSTI